MLYIDFWHDRRRSRGCTEWLWCYIGVIDFLGIVDISWVEVGVDGDVAKLEGFMGMGDRIIAVFHVLNKINYPYRVLNNKISDIVVSPK
jgi:hypothetical protein